MSHCCVREIVACDSRGTLTLDPCFNQTPTTAMPKILNLNDRPTVYSRAPIIQMSKVQNVNNPDLSQAAKIRLIRQKRLDNIVTICIHQRVLANRRAVTAIDSCGH